MIDPDSTDIPKKYQPLKIPDEACLESRQIERVLTRFDLLNSQYDGGVLFVDFVSRDSVVTQNLTPNMISRKCVKALLGELTIIFINPNSKQF